MIFDLEQDYRDAVTAMPRGHLRYHTLKIIAGALEASAHILSKDACQLGSQLEARLCNESVSYVAQLFEQCTSSALRPWLRPLTASLSPPGNILLRTFQGHRSGIHSVAWMPNGTLVMTGADDGTIKVWDVITGRELNEFRGHSGKIRAIAVTPNGRHIISGATDKMILVWDLQSDRRVTALSGHTDRIWSLVALPDSMHVVSSATDRTLRIWDLRTGEGRLLTETPRTVYGLSIHPKGEQVLGIMADGRICAWRTTDGRSEEIYCVQGFHSLKAAAFTADGSLALVVSSDYIVACNLATGEESYHYDLEENRFAAVAALPNGRRFVTAGQQGVIKLWDIGDKESVATLGGHGETVCALVVSSDGTKLLSAGEYGTAKLWLLTGVSKSSKLIVSRQLRAMALTPDSRQLVTIGDDREVCTWRINDGRQLSRIRLPVGDWNLKCCAVLPRLGRLLLVSYSEGVNLWDFNTQEDHWLLGQNFLRGFMPWRVAVTEHERRAVCACEDGVLRVWDLEELCEISTCRVNLWADALVFSSAEAIVGLGTAEGVVELWDVVNGKRLSQLGPLSANVTAMTFTHDLRLLIVACGDGSMHVWEMGQYPRLRQSIAAHARGPISVVAMPKCCRVVSVAWDQEVNVWDVLVCKLIARFHCDSLVGICTIAPDGSTICAGDLSGGLHFLCPEKFIEGGSK